MAGISFSTAWQTGWLRMRERPGLAVLLYVFTALPAIIVAAPLYAAFVDSIGASGFGPALLEEFDIVVWGSFIGEIGQGFQQMAGRLLWMVPLYLIWITAARMGLIYALHLDAVWPFWPGVRYYTGAALVLALLFVPIRVIWAAAAILGSGVLAAAIPNGVGVFWGYVVVLPLLLLLGLGYLHIAQRYAQMALVTEHSRPAEAFKRGMFWAVGYKRSMTIYVAWFGVALFVALVGALASDAFRPVGMAVWMFILLQQFIILVRTMVTVGWTASEVTYMESVVDEERPRLADEYAMIGKMHSA